MKLLLVDLEALVGSIGRKHVMNGLRAAELEVDDQVLILDIEHLDFPGHMPLIKVSIILPRVDQLVLQAPVHPAVEAHRCAWVLRFDVLIAAKTDLADDTVIRLAHQIDLPTVAVQELVEAEDGTRVVNCLFLAKGHELPLNYDEQCPFSRPFSDDSIACGAFSRLRLCHNDSFISLIETIEKSAEHLILEEEVPHFSLHRELANESGHWVVLCSHDVEVSRLVCPPRRHLMQFADSFRVLSALCLYFTVWEHGQDALLIADDVT